MYVLLPTLHVHKDEYHLPQPTPTRGARGRAGGLGTTAQQINK